MCEDRWCEVEKRVFDYLWKGQAPTSVVAFTLKLLLDRVPTRMNLVIHNIIPVEASVNCALFDYEGETSQHLFLFCEVSSNVWSLVMRWLVFLLLPRQICLFTWSVGVVKHQTKSCRKVIGLFGMQRFRNARNSRIFNIRLKTWKNG